MAESRSHKTTANRIANKLNAEYNDGQGVDIKAARVTIEVETSETVGDALGSCGVIVPGLYCRHE
jgi:hypothetical protein